MVGTHDWRLGERQLSLLLSEMMWCSLRAPANLFQVRNLVTFWKRYPSLRSVLGGTGIGEREAALWQYRAHSQYRLGGLV